MNKIFGIISNFIVLLMTISLVSACRSPDVRNEYGVPVSLFGGGTLMIKYSDYPEDAVIVDYAVSIKNTNENQILILNFTPCASVGGYCSQLYNYVFPASVSLEANEQKDVVLQVNVGGNDRAGELYVEWKCSDDGLSGEGVIFVSIDGRGDSIVPCAGTPTSCGMPGHCENVNQYDGCYDGYFRDYYCASNTKQSNSMCTPYCCGLVGGTCKSNVCEVPRFSVNLPINITNETGKPKSATITLYEPGTSIVANTTTINGYGVISSSNATVDFNLEYDSSILNILIRDLDLTGLTGTLKVTLDTVSTTIPNATLLKAYKISTSLNSFDGSLKFNYSSLSFTNEQGLAIYKCSSFNKTSNTCNENWVKMSITRYPTDNVVSTEVTSFSVYALGESQITTTTTTTATTTTTSGSSNNNDNSDSGRYSGGGRYTTTTIRTTTTLVECTCESWSNLACGESPCDQTQMKQQRPCNPSGCNVESQCIVDDLCNIQEVNETVNETLITSQPTGLFVLPNLLQYTYPIAGVIILAGAGIAIWKLNGRIRGFLPSYKFSSRSSSKKGHITVNVETPKYLEVKMVEKPKVEVTKPVEQPRINTEARNKSIDEMRKRALEIDKRMKRK